jgi:hypothetical protein
MDIHSGWELARPFRLFAASASVLESKLSIEMIETQTLAMGFGAGRSPESRHDSARLALKINLDDVRMPGELFLWTITGSTSSIHDANLARPRPKYPSVFELSYDSSEIQKRCVGLP